MNKKVKNLLLSAAMALVIGVQAVMPVSAAQSGSAGTARTWVHSKCGTAVQVTAVPKCTEWGTTPVGICDNPYHNSGDCHIFKDTYVDEYVITCPVCNVSEVAGKSAPYKKEAHRSFS